MQRQPRYGEHTYEIRVSRDVSANGVVYVRADSLTVSNGALMLSIEITPIEDMEGIEVRDSIMELPPVSVFAPGHWYTAVLVDEKHEPMYAELTPVQLAARRERRKGESYP
jgi:hypothetical protein